MRLAEGKAVRFQKRPQLSDHAESRGLPCREAADAIDHVRRMRSNGIASGESAIAWNALVKLKRTFTEPVPAMKEKSFAKTGIDAYHGRAHFTCLRSVEVGGERSRGVLS